MLYGSGLDSLVKQTNGDEAIIAEIKELEKLEFNSNDIQQREKFLSDLYSSSKQVGLMLSELF